MMKKETFEKGLLILQQAFPSKKINFDIVWPLLADLTDGEFKKAIISITTTKIEMYPRTNIIALIRKKAKELNRESVGEAWAVVLAAVSSIGSYGIPGFQNPLIAKAVNCVGWRAICMSEMIGVERAHFMKAYEALEERDHNERVSIAFNKPGQKEISKLIAGILS